MKKVFSVILALVLCLGLVIMTGCGEKEPYSGYDLTEYITLPDYTVYTTEEVSVKVTDDDVEEEIELRLEEAATTENVTKGTVEKGDTVVISFQGILADGSTSEGMTSEAYTLTLGENTMIDGFEEGLYGATIGKEVELDLQFPDPYPNNEDLAGQDVTFKVTVISKEVKNIPEYTEEFVKNNSDAETFDEYEALVKKELEAEAYDEELYALQDEIYQQILEDTEVLKYPEEEVEAQREVMDAQYQAMATSYGYDDFSKFLTEYFSMDQETYEEELTLYAQNVVKQEMVIYAIAEKEGIEVTEEEYETYIADFIASYGFESEEAFEEQVGMTPREYADENNMKRLILLEEVLDKIYDMLEKE